MTEASDCTGSLDPICPAARACVLNGVLAVCDDGHAVLCGEIMCAVVFGATGNDEDLDGDVSIVISADGFSHGMSDPNLNGLPDHCFGVAGAFPEVE